MILQRLVEYYERLVKSGKIDVPGWKSVRVSYAVDIDSEGHLLGIRSLNMETIDQSNKHIYIPRLISVPMQEGRTSGIKPYFLCDNSKYFFGIDSDAIDLFTQSNELSMTCSNYFDAAKAKYHQILEKCSSPAARAVCKYFDNFSIEKLCEIISGDIDPNDLIKRNLIFWFNGIPVTEDSAVKQAWNHYYETIKSTKENVRCLITGEIGPLAETHPLIQGLYSGKSTGSALISFNSEVSSSREHSQGNNSPISEYAAFAYTSALNYMLNNSNQCNFIGNTTLLSWAETEENGYQDLFDSLINGSGEDSLVVSQVVNQLCKGNAVEWDNEILSPRTKFFILGISPNAARICVNFWYENVFGEMLSNVMKHYHRLDIVRPKFDSLIYLPVWKLVNETARRSEGIKPNINPRLAGDLLSSIFTNRFYPSTLFDAIEIRIKADHVVNRVRASIIKAYMIQNTSNFKIKEVMTVELNSESNYLPYLLGRLFAVLEVVQKRANPSINSTIKDRYFNSASATPSVVFPILVNLAQKHLSKLDNGSRIYYEKLIQSIIAKVTETLPKRLGLDEQSAFQIGYYHQVQYLYSKAEDVKED